MLPEQNPACKRPTSGETDIGRTCGIDGSIEKVSVMKYLNCISLAAAFIFAPSGAFSATPDAPPTPAPVQSDLGLSPRVRGVVKMVDSGVAEEVIQTYISDATTPFNLTPDEIILIQDL